MARRTKEDAEKTKELLLDAAESLFLEKGVAATSLNEIARHAGLTRGAIYWHFNDKPDLFLAMHDRVKLPMDELLERAISHEDSLQALKDHCIHVLTHMASDERTKRVFTIMMLKSEEVWSQQVMQEHKRTKRDGLLKKFAQVFTAAQKAGKLAEDVTPEIAALSLHNNMCGIFLDYLRNPDLYDMQKTAPELVRLFFRALR